MEFSINVKDNPLKFHVTYINARAPAHNARRKEILNGKLFFINLFYRVRTYDISVVDGGK
jgi:hypothetical protein